MAMDEEQVETSVPSVGEQLKAARKAKKMSLEDVAASTRIPLRHLESIEQSNWNQLPAPTYTIGFAKSYASAVGLDRTAIGDQLREEMGGQRFTSATVESFEPADPARTMPKWLVIGAILAVVLVIALMSWLNNRSLQQPDAAPADQAPTANTAAPATQVSPAVNPVASSPVTIAATEAVWLQVYDLSGKNYFMGTLNPGQTFTVPPGITAPLLRTGKPEALRITVGNAVAPPVGLAGKKVSDVSLRGEDVMKAKPAPTPATTTQPPAPAPSPPRHRAVAKSPPSTPAAPAPAPAATAAPPAAPTNTNG